MCMCSSGAESRLLTAPLLVPVVPQPAKGVLLTGLGCPTHSSHWSVPRCLPMNSPFSSESLPGAKIPTQSLFFPSYLITCISFLQFWLYRCLSTSFQVVFNEIFPHVNVFLMCSLRGAEFCILLLCHLNQFLAV